MANFDIRLVHTKIDNVMNQFWFNIEGITAISVADEVINRIKQYHKMDVMESTLSINKRNGQNTLYDEVLLQYLNIHVFYMSKQRKNTIAKLINKQNKQKYSTDAPFLKLINNGEVYFIANYYSRTICKSESAISGTVERGWELVEHCKAVQRKIHAIRPNLFELEYDEDVLNRIDYDLVSTFLLEQLYSHYYWITDDQIIRNLREMCH